MRCWRLLRPRAMADLQPRVNLGDGGRAAVDQPEPALELLGRMPQLSGHQRLGVLLTQPVEYGDRVGDPGTRETRVLVGAAELLGHAREHGPDFAQITHPPSSLRSSDAFATRCV